MTKKSLLVLGLMLASFSTFAATLNCQGVDIDQGQINLKIDFENNRMGKNVPRKVEYKDLMNDGYEAERTWEAEASNILRTENSLEISGTIGDYSWFSIDMKLETVDGIHYYGESNYEEDDSGWTLSSHVQNIKCVLKK